MIRFTDTIFAAIGRIPCAVSLLAALLAAGCSKSETDGSSGGGGVTVTVEGGPVMVIPKDESIDIYFTVSPASTDFSYGNSSGNYNIKLCYAASKGVAAEAYVANVAATGGGRYRATLADRNGDKRYLTDVCLAITTLDKHVHYSDAFCIQNDDIQSGISSVSFLKRHNPQLDKDIYCDFDEQSATFTARSPKVTPAIVDAGALVATFIADGDVTVDGRRQQSGVTANDFTAPVTYVSTSGGAKREYTVKFVNFTGLPVVYVNSATHQTPIYRDITSKTEWKGATISIDGNGAFDDLPATDIQLRGRGNVTWGWNKKPFNIKFEQRTKILGMPKHKRWIMLANYADITMLRNDVAFHVSDLTSLAWAPHGEFVELVYNGQYSGTYYLVEQVRIDKNRVDIAEMQPADTDITGGYLVEMDFHEDSTPYQWKPSVSCRQNGIYLVKSPDEDDLTGAQFEYIKGYIRDFERTIMGNKLSDPDEGYRKYIEPLSFVDYWLIYEVCINHEIWNPGSVYVHKDRGGKLVAGPIWDFDYGTYNFTYSEAMPAAYSLYVKDAIWYAHLFRDPEMKALAKRRWSELKPALERVPDYIRERAAYLRYAAEENLKLWPMTVTTNGDASLGYNGAVDKMIDVWQRRMLIIDNCMEKW